MCVRRKECILLLFLCHTVGNSLRRVNSSHEYLPGCTQRVSQTVGKTAIFWTCFNRVHCTKFERIYGGMWIDARRWTQVARRRRAVEGSKGGAGAPPASAGHTARLLRIASNRSSRVRRSGVGDGHSGMRRRPGQLPGESAT